MSSSSSGDGARTYKYVVPADVKVRGGRRPQNARDQLLAIGAGLFLVGAAIFGPSGALGPAVVALAGGVLIGTGLERYQILRPEGGLVAALKGEEPDDGGEP